MHTHTLLLASLLTLSQAWVQFPGAAPLRQNPWEVPTPQNLEKPLPTPTMSGDHVSLGATPSISSISTIPTMTTIPYPTSSASTPSQSSLPLHAQLLRWIKRQGAPPTNPQAGQPNQITQVSPVTTLTMMSKGKDISVVYTQTFPSVPEQWPSPSSGEIGLGTIQGQIGVPKTKRSEPMQVLAEPTEVPQPRWADEEEDQPEDQTDAVVERRSRRRARIGRG